MENNDNISQLRTPLALKTQKNFQTNINEVTKNKEKTTRKLDENSKNFLNKNKINSKANMLSQDITNNINEILSEEDEFSYHNNNSNFTKKEHCEPDMILEKIDLSSEKIEILEITYEKNDELETLNFKEKALLREIIYVNSFDFERKQIVDNFVNEGLFFSEFE